MKIKYKVSVMDSEGDSSLVAEIGEESDRLVLDAKTEGGKALLTELYYKGKRIPLTDKAAYCEAIEKLFCQSSRILVSKESP